MLRAVVARDGGVIERRCKLRRSRGHPRGAGGAGRRCDPRFRRVERGQRGSCAAPARRAGGTRDPWRRDAPVEPRRGSAASATRWCFCCPATRSRACARTTSSRAAPSGCSAAGRPHGLIARAGVLTRKIASAIGRVDYCRVKCADGEVEPLALSGASILSSTTRADGFLIVPGESEGYGPGTPVMVFLYE